MYPLVASLIERFGVTGSSVNRVETEIDRMQKCETRQSVARSMSSPSSELSGGNRLWRIDRAKLMPGDVLLERSSGKISAAIRAATGGLYSHALVWMGNTDFMEAVSDGVRPMPFARIYTRDPTQWSLLRIEDSEAAAAAARFVREHAFKIYNLKGALISVLPVSGPERAAALFCSQLVAVGYKSAGVDLVPGITPDKITPADLQRSSLLKEAPNPFVEITNPEDRLAYGLFVDRDALFKGSVIDLERSASQEAFEAVAALAARIPHPANLEIPFPPASLGELLNVLACENSAEGTACAERLEDELNRRDYFDLSIPVAAWLSQFLQEQVAALKSGALSSEEAEETRKRLADMSASWSETEERFRINSEVCRIGYAFNGRPLLMRLAAMHARNAMSFDHLRKALEVLSVESDT